VAIYVEERIHAPLDALWDHTQDPARHERWDLRFTDIHHLPRPDPAEPQRFRYATRLGFGIGIEGTGESVGQRDLPDGSRTSSLSFGSPQARSLIREGRGYWKYVPTGDGIRFLTSYDYDVRYGAVGRLVDRLAFRPLIGWATAWSFDRLRLWLERGIDPAQAARQAVAHGVARVAIAAIFAYHGLVPKILGPDAGELALMSAAGVPDTLIRPAVATLGIAELVFAVILLATWHQGWPAWLTVLFGLGATILAALTLPGTLTQAFDPVSLNLGLVALALIDRATLDGIPSAGRCRRRPGPAAGVAPAAVGA
jgi:hypothetical protein